ncbi:zinc ribbon domain-containing protein [Priestia aryabhattai]|uniref:zinc ribbon domain-containing protein n=1 Tax=Priestia aryabhattai TaxID=412384 RepID=UPI003D275F8D
MGYCKNCGHQLVEGHQFCAECGQSMATSAEVNVNSQEENSNQNYRQTNGMSKKSKVLTASIIMAAALLGGSYYAIDKFITSPRAVAEGFVDAVQANDIQKVKKYVNEGQIELKATDEQTKSFITYLHKNPKVLSSIDDGLSEQSTNYEEKTSISKDEASPYAQLQRDGKKWGIFDNYTVRIHPAYATVMSSADATTIYLDDQKEGSVNADKEKKIGPFLPGTHKIKAIVKNEFGNIEDQQTIDSSEDEEASADFDWSEHSVYVYSDYDDATLYVNGKSTDTEIGDIDSIGPLPTDGSVKMYAKREFTSGMKKSKVVSIKKGTEDVNLLFDVEDQEDMEASTDIEAEDETSVDDKADVKGAIKAHYQSITDDAFSTAYNYFSSDRKNGMTLSDWSDGLDANIRDEVTEVDVTEVDGNEATAYIEMTSYDNEEADSTLIQKWQGSWDLVKENGQWKLDEAHLEKVDSRVE